MKANNHKFYCTCKNCGHEFNFWTWGYLCPICDKQNKYSLSIQMNKPFKTYNGGKESNGTYQKIINLMPPHDIYIEPFLGNGAIFRHKKSAFISSIGIDLDTSIIEAWKILCFPGLTLLNTDAISFLKHFRVMSTILKNLGIRVLIYLDPPYPKSSRKNQHNLYKYEMTDKQHKELLMSAVELTGVNIICSSYPNKLYNETLKDWNTIEFQSSTRNGLATEKLWFNYDTPVELHDYRYLGDNYREREAIKGRIYRNVSKLNRMTAAEQNAIIEQLQHQKIITKN